MIYYDEIGHLSADSLKELHDFAKLIGLKREWFQDKKCRFPRVPHYDLTTKNMKKKAKSNGARKINNRKMLIFAYRLGQEALRDELESLEAAYSNLSYEINTSAANGFF